MAWWIPRPTLVRAAGTRVKVIEEFVGRLNTGHEQVSVAFMASPPGWEEPAQRPEFLEITLVLRGVLHVQHESGTSVLRARQAILTQPGERVRYSTPDHAGADYVAICLPAFRPDLVHRDDAPSADERPPK